MNTSQNCRWIFNSINVWEYLGKGHWGQRSNTLGVALTVMDGIQPGSAYNNPTGLHSKDVTTTKGFCPPPPMWIGLPDD